MRCDTCGKELTYIDLRDLREIYQTKEIKKICPECETILNGHLRQLRRLTDKIRNNFMERTILNLKNKLSKK